MIRIVLAVVLATLARAAAADSCPAPAALVPTRVVARVAGKPVTVAEVDARAASALCKAQLEYQQTLYTVRDEALGALVEERLLAAEAERQKTTVEAIVSAEVAKAPAPDQAAAQALYAQYKDRIEGDFATVEPQIMDALRREATAKAYQDLVGRLRDAAHVTVDLPPIRLPVEAKGQSRGPADAPVTIVSFADYQCPYCGRGAATLKEVREKYGDRVREVFRDFPLGFHERARPAAVAARCAGEQGRFWQMHDHLFEHQTELERDQLAGHALAVGLDPAKFAACVKDDAAKLAAIEADLEAGQAVGVEGTPAFFINGISLSGAQPTEAFSAIIDRELAASAKGADRKKK